jgi:hypothetical protein
MRNSLALVLLFASVCAAPARRAKEDPSNLELHGGYGYVRFNINANVSGQPPSQTFNANSGAGIVFRLG